MEPQIRRILELIVAQGVERGYRLASVHSPSDEDAFVAEVTDCIMKNICFHFNFPNDTSRHGF